MDLGEIDIRRLNSTSQIQSPEETASRFIDRFIRLKTTYWNRGFVIVMLTFIGLTILLHEYISLKLSLMESREEYDVVYLKYGLYVGYFPGGILATVYPAHKIFGISFIVSSIYHSMEFMNRAFFLNTDLHNFFRFCIGTTMATAYAASHGVCTFWIPLKKQSLRYVPILLWLIFFTQLYDTINVFSQNKYGFIVLVWLPLLIFWVYVINGDRSQGLFRPFRDSNTVLRSFGISVISLIRSIILDIPWKSFCTSLPVMALVLSYICFANTTLMYKNYYISYYPLKTYPTIMWLLLFVLLELFPEITLLISVTNVRKLFSCTILIATSVVFLLIAFKVKKVLILETNDLLKFIFNEMEYFYLFGFYLNHLDIAPKYASVLFGFQLTIFHISRKYLDNILQILRNSEIRNDFRIHVLMAVIYMSVAVFYAIFASAEIQPWGEDKPVKENQRNMYDEVVLPAV